MARLPWLALAAGLLLFGCAATVPQPSETAQAQVCATATSADLTSRLAALNIKLKADLEGEPLEALINFLMPHLPQPVPEGVDRVLIFERDGTALIVWFKDDCAVDRVAGPWEPIKRHLGTPV